MRPEAPEGGPGGQSHQEAGALSEHSDPFQELERAPAPAGIQVSCVGLVEKKEEAALVLDPLNEFVPIAAERFVEMQGSVVPLAPHLAMKRGDQALLEVTS